MEGQAELRQMASEGKDKLEWSRTVDAEKLEQLKEMMASPDYKVILPYFFFKVINHHFRRTFLSLFRQSTISPSLPTLTSREDRSRRTR